MTNAHMISSHPSLVKLYGCSTISQAAGFWQKSESSARNQRDRVILRLISYVIETSNGQVLRRNRRHLQDTKPVKKTVRFEDENHQTEQHDSSMSKPSFTVSQTNNVNPMPVANDSQIHTYDNDTSTAGYKTRSGRINKAPTRYD